MNACTTAFAASEESDLVINQSCCNWKYVDRQVAATWSARVNLLSIVTPRSRAVSTTLTADDNTGTCRMSTCSIWNLESELGRVRMGIQSKLFLCTREVSSLFETTVEYCLKITFYTSQGSAGTVHTWGGLIYIFSVSSFFRTSFTKNY